jgi:hypothetical protein
MHGPTRSRDKDSGIIHVLLDRLNTLRMPRVLKLKEQVDRGEPLSSLDLEFLKRALSEGGEARRLAMRRPEYKPIVDQMAQLYNDVLTKGAQNERNPRPKPKLDDSDRH